MGIVEPSIFVHCITGCGFPLAAHLSRILSPSFTEIKSVAFSGGVMSETSTVFENFAVFYKSLCKTHIIANQLVNDGEGYYL